MELSALKFSVETQDLEKASGLIGNLVTNLEKLDKASIETAKAEALLAKASRDTAKANLDNAKAEEVVATAVEKRTKAVERSSAAAKKNTDLLQMQGDTYEFILEGFSKGDAKVLAMAKATGQLSDELKKVLTDIRQFSKNTFDQTETGLDRMVKSAKEASTAQNFLNEGLRLTTKQAKELSNDLERLNIRLQHQGASYQEIVKQQAIYKQNFIEEASAVNRATDALSNIEKQRRDTASASNYLTQADQRMAAALNQSNAALDKGSTDSLVKYETALRKSGISQELATQKLATYKTQLAQVQQLENRRREEFLARAIMPQVTDVAVSLWSGQNPLTVLLQQGGQVTDLFNQSGIAADKFGESVKTAMKGMLPSILTVVKGVGGLLVDGFVSAGNAARDFLGRVSGITAGVEFFKRAMVAGGEENFRYVATLQRIGTVMSGVFGAGIAVATAGLISLTVSLVQVIKEENQLVKVLALNAGSMALTRDTATAYAMALSGAAGTTSQFIKAIGEMAKAGKFTREEISSVATTAVQMAQYFDVAIEDTVKSFAKLKDDPVKNLIELAKQTGMVTEETIRAVSELEKQGRTADSTALAIKALADVNKQQVEIMKRDYNSFSLWLIETGANIKQFFSNAFADLWRGNSTDALRRELDGVQERINKLTGGTGKGNLFNWAEVEALQARSRSLEQRLALRDVEAAAEEASLKRNAEAAVQTQFRLNLEKQLSDARSSQAKDTLTLEQFQNKYVEDAIKKANESLRLDKEKINLTDSQIAQLREVAKIEYENSNKAKKDPSENFYATLMREATNNTIGAVKATEELTKSELRLLEVRDDPRFKAFSAIQKQNVVTQFEAAIADEKKNAASEKLNAAEELKNKILGKSVGLGKDYYKTLERIQELNKEGVFSASDVELLTEALYKATPAYQSNLKAVESLNDKLTEYKKNSMDSASSLQADNNSLDMRVAVLGKTAEEQKVITKEYAKQSKLSKIALDLEKKKLDIQKDFADNPVKRWELENQAEQAAAEERKVINREVAVQAAEDYDAEFKKIKSTVSESITAALFDGGKAGSSKIKDYLKAELRERITLSIDAFINPIMGAVSGALGFGGSSGASSAAGGASNLLSGVGLIGKLGGSFGMGMKAGSAALFGEAGLMGALDAGTIALQSGNIMGGLGTIAGSLGPIAGGVMAIYSLAKALDDSGTYHTGGAAQYSAFGGANTSLSFLDNQEGLPGYDPNNNIDNQFGLGFGYVERGDQTILAMQQLSKSLVQIFDGIAKTFGKTAGYEVATAFADDTSEDGAWGAFKVQLGGVEILNWDDFRQSRWAPKEFGDGEEGYKQYLSAISKDTRKVLMDMDLPSWANKILSDLGESASIESLTSAIAQIGNIRTVFENLKSTFTQLSSVGDSALESLMNLSGGIDSLANAASSYYNNFYSDVEKANKLQSDLTKSLAEYNLALPATKEAYRALVEAQNVSTEAGARAYVALLQNSSMFAELIAMQAELANAEKERLDEVARLEQERLDEIAKLKQEADDAEKKRLEELASLQKDAFDSLSKGLNDLISGATQTVNTLSDSLKTVKDLRNALLGGSDSSLSGTGKYSLAKSLFGSTIGSAMQGDSKAISSLSQTANDFLAASKENASSQFEYLLDFNDVLNQTGVLESSLTGQLSVAEMQLNSLKSIAETLGVIADNTKVKTLDETLSTYFKAAYGSASYDTVNALYASLGRSGFGFDASNIDAEGMKFWLEYAKSNNSVPLGTAFNQSALSQTGLLGSTSAGSLIAPEIAPMQTSNQVQTVTASNVSALVEQHLSDVRFEIRAVAFNTEKMAKILDRVTQDKTSVTVTIAE